jgi:hypothetical protein
MIRINVAIPAELHPPATTLDAREAKLAPEPASVDNPRWNLGWAGYHGG